MKAQLNLAGKLLVIGRFCRDEVQGVLLRPSISHLWHLCLYFQVGENPGVCRERGALGVSAEMGKDN
jgi:hypothetical protein